MYFSFYKVLPWTTCGPWASNCCILDEDVKPGYLCTRDDQTNPDGTPVVSNWTSPSQEFWEYVLDYTRLGTRLNFRNEVLRVTRGVEDMGSINYGMVLCLALSWIVCYFCVWKGVKQTGKVNLVGI